MRKSFFVIDMLFILYITVILLHTITLSVHWQVQQLKHAARDTFWLFADVSV